MINIASMTAIVDGGTTPGPGFPTVVPTVPENPSQQNPMGAPEVRSSFIDRHEVHQAGRQTILEYWIPAEDLDDLNKSIVVKIEVVAEYR